MFSTVPGPRLPRDLSPFCYCKERESQATPGKPKGHEDSTNLPIRFHIALVPVLWSLALAGRLSHCSSSNTASASHLLPIISVIATELC